jgi:hypothetical protein
MLAERDAAPSELLELLRPACFGAHEVPVGICKLAHLQQALRRCSSAASWTSRRRRRLRSFWAEQPEAGTRPINTYLDSGRVDDSLYEPISVDLTPDVTATALAKGIAGTMVGLALLTVGRWVRRSRPRSSSSRRTW